MPKRALHSRVTSGIIDAVGSLLGCIIPLVIYFFISFKNPGMSLWEEPYFLYVLLLFWAAFFFAILVGIIGPINKIMYLIFMGAGTFIAYTYMGVSYLFYHLGMYHFFYAGSMIFVIYTIYLATDTGDNDNLAIRMGATLGPVLLGLITVLWFMKIQNFPPLVHLILVSVINFVCLIINIFKTLKFFRYHTYETVLNRKVLIVEHTKNDGKLSQNEILESVNNMVKYYGFGRSIQGDAYRLSDWTIENLQNGIRRLYEAAYQSLNNIINKVNYKLEHTTISTSEEADKLKEYCDDYKSWIDNQKKEIDNKIEDLTIFLTFLSTERFGSKSDKGKVFEYDLGTCRREIRYDKTETSFKAEIIGTSIYLSFDGYTGEAELDDDYTIVEYDKV